ncbi:uncharacterized protein L199_000973 [Kwoniella botswanensis]|uniref:uncharacterized protein n=1 Tax=Kwoniella botswanensis TaxID=1268659 RepID=UPI00315D48E1
MADNTSIAPSELTLMETNPQVEITITNTRMGTAWGPITLIGDRDRYEASDGCTVTSRMNDQGVHWVIINARREASGSGALTDGTVSLVGNGEQQLLDDKVQATWSGIAVHSRPRRGRWTWLR